MKRSEVKALVYALVSTYESELDQLGPRAFSKKSRGDLVAGFRDGVRSTLMALQQQDVIIGLPILIIEEDKEETTAS